MLDDVDPSEGRIVIIPGQGGQPPAQPPPSGQPPSQPGNQPPSSSPPASQPPATAAPTNAPPAGPVGSAGAIGDVIRSALASGIYLSQPSAGTPAAVVVEEIAKQCGKPVADVHKAMRTLFRTTTAAKFPLASLDKKENGALLSITVPAPAAKMPDALACIALPKPAEAIRIDLLISAREFGPNDAANVEAAALAKSAKDLNAAFGDPARPWRLATAEELLAILRVLFDENLLGPDGRRFWTSASLTNGQHVVIEAKPAKPDYSVGFELADNSAKGAPIWVRNRN